MRIIFIFLLQFCCVFITINAFAEKHDTKYSIAGINKQLLQNANAVVRSYTLDAVVDEDGRDLTLSEHYVVTILNEKGRAMGDLIKESGSYDKVLKIDGRIYDADGNMIQKIKRGDLSFSNATLVGGYYDDTKFLKYKVKGVSFPYTVEYNVQTRQDHLFFMPEFSPRDSTDEAVEYASFSVTAPTWFKIKYRQYGYKDSSFPIVSAKGGYTTYLWHIDNLSANKDEPMEYKAPYAQGAVVTTPVEFKFGGYTGKMNSWEEFSSFVYELNKERNDLPAHIKQKVKSLVANETDVRRKIAVLYKFLQDNTRYVAIEYGLSGWQTFSAEHTAENQYGDCKALSNYMQGLLKEAGIASNAVLVHAGDKGLNIIEHSFPCQQFNHVILQVPLENDTVWLECTSKDLPAGYLSDFTHDREALVVLEKGGGLVHTPVYDTATNKITRVVEAKCNKNGSVTANMINTYYGEPAIDLSWKINGSKAYEIQQYVNEKLNLRSYSVPDFSHKRIDSDRNVIVEELLSLVEANMITETNDYILVDHDLAPLEIPYIVQVGTRRSSFKIDNTIQVCDTFIINLPVGSNVIGCPDSLYLLNSFGQYRFKVNVENDKVTIARQFIQLQGIYKPEQFVLYEKWLDAIRRNNKHPITLSKG